MLPVWMNNEHTKAFLDMDIDGDGLLGLVENGGNALAAEIIPNVAHRLKVIRKINYLARHQGDGNIIAILCDSLYMCFYT
ncbi:hypothetical protein OS493_038349 [Desmophyllum pertusum]|uniref:Uncharacterized protein n=1 Tax=Desmophyllum pertusum TaxID=174260 RepID=A0A9W9YHL7_9CNID|nr:hypothetical protein OS493_038349 [Desmophyllum pertusum]